MNDSDRAHSSGPADANAGVSLERAVVSIAKTQRGRFFWAAWWTGPPSVTPFRIPDATSGGATSWHDARANAERITGRALADIDSEWAHAFLRTLRGQPPFNEGQRRRALGEAAPVKAKPPRPASIWEKLGVAAGADELAVRRAYRLRALETHPDRGGSADAFREVRAAYEAALRRLRR